jgi:hypothetical protein
MTFTAELWRSEGAAAWHFVTLPPEAAEQVEHAREQAGGGAGFGSVPVEVTVGGSTWRTSVFPDTRSGSFVLPVKAAVRRQEDVGDGDLLSVHLVTNP